MILTYTIESIVLTACYFQLLLEELENHLKYVQLDVVWYSFKICKYFK